MTKNTLLNKLKYTICTLILILSAFIFTKIDVLAVDFPQIHVSFDTGDESIIVDGIPASSSDGSVEYQLEGYLNYEKERVETFCYAPKVRPYDVPEKMAYIFNWSGDAEFLLPCSGDYKFTAYVTARYVDSQGQGHEEKGPKTTISITLHKKDESTNWGPGLPNTTVETYDLKQIKGKNKTIKIEEPEYTWTINGKDIEKVPEQNLSLKVTANPDIFPNDGVEEFFGDTLVQKLNIEHNGEFGFQAVLDYILGTEYAGKYANLFYVVGYGTFEFTNASVVDENGVASFSFTHASDYVLAVTDVEYTGQELNPKAEEPTQDPQPEEETGSSDHSEGIAPDADTDANAGVSTNASPVSGDSANSNTETVSGENAPSSQETTSSENTQQKVTQETTPAMDGNPASETATQSNIGGTDGPSVSTTATTSVGVSIWLVIGVVALLAGIIVVFLIIKKKNIAKKDG